MRLAAQAAILDAACFEDHPEEDGTEPQRDICLEVAALVRGDVLAAGDEHRDDRQAEDAADEEGKLRTVPVEGPAAQDVGDECARHADSRGREAGVVAPLTPREGDDEGGEWGADVRLEQPGAQPRARCRARRSLRCAPRGRSANQPPMTESR